MFWKKKIKKTPIEKSKATECQHDWEIISKGKIYQIYTTGPFPKKIRFTKEPKIYADSRYVHLRQAINRVCVKCGKCDNQEARWLKEDRERRKEVRRRKAWAQQLWNDGCKKETTS